MKTSNKIKLVMVCSDFAVFRKTIYSAKQRNIYEHIYRTLLTTYSNPPTEKTHLQTTNASNWLRDKCPDETTL